VEQKASRAQLAGSSQRHGRRYLRQQAAAREHPAGCPGTRRRHSAVAEAYFDRALAAAREQQAKCWELRAAMSMARLWRDQCKRQKAHDLLMEIGGRFTEGFDTLDLKEVKALLEQLKA
jgi:predicted ATPase